MAPSTTSSFDFAALAQGLRERAGAPLGAGPCPHAVAGVSLEDRPAAVRALLRSPGVGVAEDEEGAAFVTSAFHCSRFASPAWPRPFIGLDGDDHARGREAFTAALAVAVAATALPDPSPPADGDLVAWADDRVGAHIASLFGLGPALLAHAGAALPAIEATFDVEVDRSRVREVMVARRRLRNRLADHVAGAGRDGPFVAALAGAGCPVDEQVTLLELALATSWSTTRGLVLNTLARAAEEGADLAALAAAVDWSALTAWGRPVEAPVQLVRRRVLGPGTDLPVGATVLLELGRAEHHRAAGAAGPTLAFGAGTHRCPGRAVALDLARHLVLGLTRARGRSRPSGLRWADNVVLRHPSALRLDPPDEISPRP